MMRGVWQRMFWNISDECWRAVAAQLEPGMRTLETGSGRSTALFEQAGCAHVALEHDPRYRVSCASVVLAPLTGDPPWYDWAPPHPFDLVLIDGPPWWIGRAGILRVLPRVLHERSVIVMDDTHRRAERRLAARIAAAYSLRIDHHRGSIPGLSRGFSVLAR